jgi:hypothetical protein
MLKLRYEGQNAADRAPLPIRTAQPVVGQMRSTSQIAGSR